MDDLSRYGRAQRILELAGTGLFFFLVAVNAPALAWTAYTPALALAAWLAADLLSGIAHWAFDRFGSVRTPFFGPAFIRPFREHHVEPAAMTRHDWVETNGSSCLACLPLLSCALFLHGPGKAFLVFLCAGILVTNQCHKWAHMARPPRIVRALQRLHIVLRPEMHRLHHAAPFTSHYSTANGWLNPLLNKILR
jgi:plasmanylethanolamine desaturase